MRIDILTLFPDMFESVFGASIIKRAREKRLLEVKIHNLRRWTRDRHKTADDRPFGGGPGMVMKPEPIYEAIDELAKQKKRNTRVILLTPQGKKLNQKIAGNLSRYKRLILIAGHYEGVDERVRRLAQDEISIGDYILTCGELPAMVLVDAVVRLIPGVLGSSASGVSESFEQGLLEYPQYTRPAAYRGMKAPEVLLSGDHKKIAAWREKEAIKRTKKRRPDLMNK